MKLFKLTTMMALMFAMASQSAFALGRITSVEEMTASTFKCEKLAGEQLKHGVASADARETERKVIEREQTGTAASSL